MDRTRIRKSRTRKSGTRKLGTKNTIWGIYGKVYNPSTHTYVRIGTNQSMKAIGDLKRDAEWKKRVDYIISHHKGFGEKLKHYLNYSKN